MTAWTLPPDWPAWGMLAGGLLLAMLYSGAETGAYTVNKIRLDLRAEAGHRRARALAAALRDPRELLTVLLIGNNLAHYVASAGMVMLLSARQWRHPQWCALAILTPVVFVLGDLFPKNLFYRHGETLTYLAAGPLTVSRKLFKAVGLVAVIRGVIALIARTGGRRLGLHEDPLSRSGRIASILAEGRASGAITHAQSVIADRVVNLPRLRMRDVMVPLERAALADESASREQFRELLRTSGHARYGVYSDNRGNIVGALNVYDVLLDPETAEPAAHMTTPVRLQERLGVLEALVQLQTRGETMGFVVAPDGRCVGLVTVKDLVEEIVGELEEW